MSIFFYFKYAGVYYIYLWFFFGIVSEVFHVFLDYFLKYELDKFEAEKN